MSGGFEVQKSQCRSCIYKRNSPLNLKSLEAEIRDNYGGFKGFRICHHSTSVCCRGFWNRHKNKFATGQIAQRLGLVKFVEVDNIKS